MGIRAEQLANLYPFVYHMAEDGSWENIRQRGLMSTSALLDLFEIKGERRFAIESQHRPGSVRLEHPNYGTVVIRDQKPMRESSLRKCLEGMSPQEWYELLNSRVFFWATEQRLMRLLSAREYRNRTHCVLKIDTAKLLGQYSNSLALSPINSGSTIYKPQPRGKQTFLRMEDYPFAERKKKRGVANAIAEMCIEHSVPNLAEFVIRAYQMTGNQVGDVLFER